MGVQTITHPTFGEMRVETGTGRIDTVDVRETNVGVKIISDNRSLREPVTGWLDGYAAPADILTVLRGDPDSAKGRLVEYRIEVHRKPGVDADKPLAKVGNHDKVRELALLRFIDDHQPQARSQDGAPTAASAPDSPPERAEADFATDPRPDLLTPETIRLVAVRLIRMASSSAGSAGSLLPGHPAGARLIQAAAVLRDIAEGLAA